MQFTLFLVASAVALSIGWLVVALVKFVLNATDQVRAAKKFPGGNDSTHWLFGNIPHVMKVGVTASILEMREKAMQGVRVYVRWTPFLQPRFTIMHPDPARDILVTAEPKSKRFHGSYSVVEPWLGDGLLLSSGKKWERSRRLLTPAFHYSILNTYFDIYNDASKEFVEAIKRCMTTDEYVDVPRLSTLLTLDVILRCAFSYKGDIQRCGHSHPFTKATLRLADLVLKRLFTVCPEIIYRLTPSGREFYQLVNYVHTFSQDIINKRRSELERTPDLKDKKYLDFLDILLTARDSDGGGLSNKEIRDEVDTFLFEGHDTTGSLVTFSLYALAKYPEVQVKVREEITSVLGTKSNVIMDDLSKLNYTSMFMKETMRMYPPVPSVSRDLSRPLEIDGVLLPKNSRINININHIHYNGDVWDRPEEFHPERFSNENWTGRHPFMHVPFAAGPRNCIGQNLAIHEEKVMLCHVVRNFEIALKPDHEIAIYPTLVLRSSTGVPLKFTAIE